MRMERTNLVTENVCSFVRTVWFLHVSCKPLCSVFSRRFSKRLKRKNKREPRQSYDGDDGCDDTKSLVSEAKHAIFKNNTSDETRFPNRLKIPDGRALNVRF